MDEQRCECGGELRNCACGRPLFHLIFESVDASTILYVCPHCDMMAGWPFVQGGPALMAEVRSRAL